MKLEQKLVPIDTLSKSLESWLADKSHRLGFVTSIDGGQLLLLLFDLAAGTAELWESELKDSAYTSLTLLFPQVHWYERVLCDMFGILPRQHPRLKPVIIHEEYPPEFYPLRQIEDHVGPSMAEHKHQNFLEVHGDGVWELPVGPIHAGVIEPAHFRCSCLGETIVNLELQLGFLHRGVEKKITQIPWQKARFVVESTATDTAVANALAHAVTIESLFEVELPPRTQILRTIALETERVAMHVVDVGGMMTDMGMVPMAQTMSKLRGHALNLGQALTGSRFMRAFVLPGGVAHIPSADSLTTAKNLAIDLRNKLKPVLSIFQDNQAAIGRMEGIGKVKRSLANEFGFVGVASRACGLDYDARRHFSHGVYPEQAPPVALDSGGDILSRTNVRIKEIWSSLDLLERLIDSVSTARDTAARIELGGTLPANKRAAAVVEAFRGELIHLCLTDDAGRIKRYAIKDPSQNNWTMIPICVRDNLIADFPLCNKSMALSYGGNDL